jgi:hypothetical protein
MFNVNLEKELISSKRASLTKEEQVLLAEAEKIISNSTEEDMRVLSAMGLNYSVEKSKKLENKIKFIKAFDKTRVFSTDEIKALCQTYGLRFLSISKYKGEIDPLLPTKVKEFEAIHKQVMEGSTSSRWQAEFRYNNFMICAPKESFKLSERPKDPLLFYPIHDAQGNMTGDYFLVHKWGSDISAWNAIKAWRNKNWFTWFAYVTVLYMLPLTAIASVVFNWNLGFFSTLGFAVSASLINAAILGIASPFKSPSSGDFYSGKFTDENWNNEFKD